MTMVTISHKVWPWSWALLFLLKALSMDIKAASTSCYLGEGLDTSVSKSIVTDLEEGVYLLKDAIPCSGRVTSIELCGGIVSSSSTINFTSVYLNAALYRPHQTDQINSLERITEVERFESRSSATIELDNGLRCARLSIARRNWTAFEGDMLGVSFVNTSCEVETFRTVTVQTCPVYVAVHTNRSSDMVYISENSTATHLDTLSNIKINLQVFVEPFPPSFSDVCDPNIQENALRSETVIMNPSEQQIFTGSGTYIMSDGVECTGYVDSITFCGGLVDEREPWPHTSVYRFTLLHLRLSGDRYDIIDQEDVNYEVANATSTSDSVTTFNPTCQSHDISGWFVLQGDQLGATLYARCERSQSSRESIHYCPVQIGLINTGCTHSSLYVNDTFGEPSSYYSKGPDSIPKRNTSKVAIKLNFGINYDVIDQCPGQIPLHLRIIYGISVAFVAIIIFLVVSSTLLMVRLKRTKPQVYDAIKRGVRQGSIRIRNSLSRRTPTSIHGLQNRSFSEQNDYSVNYNHALTAQAELQQIFRINQWSHHQTSGSYEEPIDAIEHYEVQRCDIIDEDRYIDPPNKEMELKEQLQRMEVLRENIQLKEYLGSGRFGIVYRGQLRVTGVDSEEVAVKTMENGASEGDRVKFLQEAAIMGQFNNPYIVKIYGLFVSSQPYMIISELMNKGDLRCYLNTVKISGSQDAELDDITVMLLTFSRQVASAMLYLTSKGFVHRDLAARNILVSMDRICKVSDFGLSRDLQNDDYYIAHGGLIPVRWTAPEALKRRKYSTASDVWSYGVVLFEIWSLGSRPYGTLNNEQVLRKVLAGYRLPSPAGCPRAVYSLMISCWHPEAIQRPTFAQLHASLQQPDSVLMEWSEDDQAKYSENARTIGAMFQDGEVLHSTLQRAYLVPEAEK